jgi:phosphatidylserine/phosphatidylglycerophosphate/cardiolipin synthase-like enzyme
MHKTQKYFLAAILASLATLAALAFERPYSPHSKIISATGTIELAFTPEDRADKMITSAIKNARRQILVQAFSFTDEDIAHALIKAKKRVIDVQLVADAEQTEKTLPNVVSEIADSGIPTYLDSRHQSAHNKIMVIDVGTAEPAVITGSLNFTYAAQYKNAENLVIFRSNPDIAAAYLRNWENHLAHSSLYHRPN